MLAARGYEVVAFTRKAGGEALLKRVGASSIEVMDGKALSTRPLEPERWAGAVDNVGGALLSWLLRGTRMQGSVAAVGLAGGAELNVSVMPFILRGANLLGVNSAATRRAKRLDVWGRISGDLAPRHLDDIVTRTVGLDGLGPAFESVLAGNNTGRTLVRIHDQED
jgi:putative YhdH/YhfP family quinone oxidoreductase